MDIAARVFNFSLMIAMPIVLAVYLTHKLKTEWRLFGVGVVTFVTSQVLHLPFNIWILNPWIEKLGLSITQSGVPLLIVGVFYGLSAGLFEEITRYIGYRVSIKDERDWKSALMYGTGHGGIEAIIIGILSLLTLLRLVSIQGADLSTIVEAEYLELARSQVEAYWAAPWHLILLGALERVIAICFHLSATVLVLQSFRRKNILWLVLAIGWHTVLDAVAVFASQTWNPYITEGILLVIGLLSLGIIFGLKSIDTPQEQGVSQITLNPLEIQPVTPSKENLEDSRYV
jgi:uncharacterized membrane protein YhfC